MRKPGRPSRGTRRRFAAGGMTVERLESRALLAAGLPVVSIADASIAEGDAETRRLSFAVTLSAPARFPVSVRYTTADGTAQARAGDYTSTSGWVRIAAGRSQATVTVVVRGDAAHEPDETCLVRLSLPANCTLGRSAATGTILNDDPAPPPPVTGSWTILVYMSGEDLNSYARTDINEMEKALVGLPGSVRFAVSWDQPRSGVGRSYATGGGKQAAWRTYGRSVLQADGNTSTIASTFDLSAGERNTGDPATLVDFVKWGVANAPAERYVLQMWGHGEGIVGSQFDSESRDDALTIAEMAAALAAPGMPSIDVVSYDNCLMAMAEVGAALTPGTGSVFVASQELINGTGQDYATAFAGLKVANPGAVTAAEVAAGMVKSYGIQYAGDRDGCDTFSATVASGYAGLTASLKAFVDATAGLTAADRTVIRAAAAGSIAYDVASFRDLGSFMGKVATSASLPAALKTAAGGVRSALTALVTAKTADQRSSSGVSIYLPTSSADEFLATYRTDAAAFCAATGWDTFAKWLATGTRSAATAARSGRSGTRGQADDATLRAAYAALAAATPTATSLRRVSGWSRPPA